MARLRSTVVRKVLVALDGLLQRLVPPRADQLAWLSDPDHIGNAFHLHRHAMVTRPGLQHVWLVGDPAATGRIEAAQAQLGDAVAPGARVRVVARRSLRGYWAYLRSARILHTHGAYPMTASARRGRQVVSLWHGMPIKCIGALNTISPNPNPTFGTLHLATSPWFRDVIAAAFLTSTDRVLHTSLPRCDVLVRPHPQGPDAAAVRAAFGVPAGKRMVLWMPTYRASIGPGASPAGRSFLDELGAEHWRAVDEEAGRHGAVVVVKLHPHDVLNQSGRDLDAELGLANVTVVTAGAWLATGIELYDALTAADGLLSDVSSVLIDCLVTSMPLGIIGFDPTAYTRDVVLPVASLLESSRIRDLAEVAAVGPYFERVAAGAAGADPDDLSAWLHDAEPGAGCETVLRAIGL
jgi:CDP-glycerol glycerophosphotransferase (TagB/SpsB family)